MNISEIEKVAIFLETQKIDGVASDAILRTSCSKHYYHLFHLVSAWFLEKFESFSSSSGGATHQAVRVCCDLLGDHFKDKEFKKLALKLKHLHDIRVSADYRVEDSFNSNSLRFMKIEKDRTLSLIEGLKRKYAQTLPMQV